MKTKMVALTLLTSAIINVSPNFAKKYMQFNSKRKFFNKGIEFYPVKFNNGKQREGINFENKSLKLITEKPLIASKDFNIDTIKNDAIGIRIDIEDKLVDSLSKLSQKYAGAMLGVFHEGEPVAVLKMKAKRLDKGLFFTVDDAAKFERFVHKLEG